MTARHVCVSMSFFALALAWGCSTTRRPEPPSAARSSAAAPRRSPEDVTKLKAELVAVHGEAQRARIERGIEQVAALWRAEDGDLAAFVRERFLADPAGLKATRDRLEAALEQIDGHLLEIGRELRWRTETDTMSLSPVDPLLAGIDPRAHVVEDLFRSKIAFVVLLNFPQTTLAERVKNAGSYSRDEWAAVRLAGRFAMRVPAEVRQRIAEVDAAADLYVDQYNVWMHHVLAAGGERLFPKGMRLVSHWNLRDQIRADYADPRGPDKQRLIAKVMERIVTQTIPAAVIDNPRVDWDPVTNEVRRAPPDSVEANAPARDVPLDAAAEPNQRYAHWIEIFHALRAADPYSPIAPTAIVRSFDLEREIPEERVREMLVEVVSSPLLRALAGRIQQALAAQHPDRRLEPFDIWYNGFQPRGRFTEAELDSITRQRYPDAATFAADIPRILRQLGFPEARARFLAEHIAVDPARGPGHAMQAERRGDRPRLRTRVGKGGMDYKGYNIAVHELGHTVEQVISLYDVDHTLLAGVPNGAFTEAIAMMSQARDLELLGLAKPDPEAERRQTLHELWATYEIAGVSLVDIGVWHWLYDHPDATPAEMRDAVVAIAKDVWNRYYAPVFGVRDVMLLAIYSHHLAYPLYLTNYTLGHIIAFQLEEKLAKAAPLGVEIDRVARLGAVTPDHWMQQATGSPVSPKLLLEAARRALGL